MILSAAAWAVRDLRSLSGERERSELLARKDTVELACREGLELQRGEFERAELGRGCSENSIRVVLEGSTRAGGNRLFQTNSFKSSNRHADVTDKCSSTVLSPM